MGNKTVQAAARLSSVNEYYFSKKLREIDTMNKKGKGIINLGIGSPDLAPPQSVIKAMASNVLPDHHHQYQPYKGIPALREAFSKWYATYFSVKLDPDKEILPLIGSKEGIMHISMAFVNNEDVILVPDPGYPTYEAAAKLAGGIVRKYPLIEDFGWLPDYQSLEESDLSKVKMMWVNYPHMPTGSIMTARNFETLVDFARRNNIILINDNPYSLILNDNPRSILKYRDKYDFILELNSLSKSHNMAGWRIGVVSGNADLIDIVLRFKSNMDSGMFLPIQLSAIEALEEDKTWYMSQNKTYLHRRELAWKFLDHLNCVYTKKQTGIFIWAKIPDAWQSSESFSEAILHQARVFVTPGHIFGKQGDKYIRVSLCSNEDLWQKAHERILKRSIETIENRKLKIA